VLRRGALILIIDDDEETRDLLRDVLTDEGYRVITARTAEGGQAQCLYEQPDLIVTDRRLPGRSGDEFVEWYRSELRGSSPVIMISASVPSERVSSRERFIPKPFDLGEFLQAVNDTVAGDEETAR
jgi:DNA-binding response OmpR family regulator